MLIEKPNVSAPKKNKYHPSFQKLKDKR